MSPHDEDHSSHRIGLLRAMVLGANDGIISTACLVLGVAAATAERSTILTAGMAGLVAGAASMALGEYVSVSSQRDSEQSDIAKEKWELEHTPDIELAELAGIYRKKSLPQALAQLGDTQDLEWRVHFHVPIFLENYGTFQSTQEDIVEVLKLVKADPSISSHLEVETYTWEVLPEDTHLTLGEAISRELAWVREQLQ